MTEHCTSERKCRNVIGVAFLQYPTSLAVAYQLVQMQ